MAQDIYPAITGNTLYVGSALVGYPGNKPPIKSFGPQIPVANVNILSISGKYDTRFDDVRYYTASGNL